MKIQSMICRLNEMVDKEPNPNRRYDIIDAIEVLQELGNVMVINEVTATQYSGLTFGKELVDSEDELIFYSVGKKSVVKKTVNAVYVNDFVKVFTTQESRFKLDWGKLPQETILEEYGYVEELNDNLLYALGDVKDEEQYFIKSNPKKLYIYIKE